MPCFFSCRQYMFSSVSLALASLGLAAGLISEHGCVVYVELLTEPSTAHLIVVLVCLHRTGAALKPKPKSSKRISGHVGGLGGHVMPGTKRLCLACAPRAQ
eukprot:EC119449.1.p1 GENE.EC119449.1~~EC119449.1.p1  ORF type:complete len:101 (-),score=3.10 EC119449.1:70-372(-)